VWNFDVTTILCHDSGLLFLCTFVVMNLADSGLLMLCTFLAMTDVMYVSRYDGCREFVDLCVEVDHL
jgi:hypothetical protein